jgi:hypothetical protein
MGLTISYFNQQTSMTRYLDIVLNVIHSNSKNLQKDNITFLDNKYKAQSTFERGILNLFQVIDQNSNFALYKTVKTYQIKNDDIYINKVNNILKTISSLSNDKIIKIENFSLDNNNKKGKILRLYIIEEYTDYISLQQLLGFLYDDYINRKLIFDIDILYEELINLCVDILEHIDYLHSHNIKNTNINLNNIMYCKNKHTFIIKFTDIEAGEIYRVNFDNEKVLNDMHNVNNDDYHNFLILLFQLIFFIKNLSLKNVFDYSVIYDLYKTNIRVIKNELGEIFENDSRLLYFRYLLEYMIDETYDKVKELNSVYKQIVTKKMDFEFDMEMMLDLLFSAVQLNERDYLDYFFRVLNEYHLKNQKWLLSYIIEKKQVQYFITKYINFIQIHYQKNKKIDLMSLINECINEFNLYEEIPKMKVYGIFPLILAYLNNCDVDFITILSLMKKFSSFNTCSIVNIAEKINFNSSLLKFFENNEVLNEEVTLNLSKILPMLRYIIITIV